MNTKYNPDKKYRFVHTEFTGTDAPVDTRKIDAEERTRGYFRCGWHFIIDPDGTVYPGRPVGMPGTRNGKRNADTLSVLLAGAGPFVQSGSQKESLQQILAAHLEPK